MSGYRNVVITSPCKLQYRGGYLEVRKEDDTTRIHLGEISSVVLQTNQVFVSAYLLSELAKSKVSFVVSDEKCDPIGQYLPLYGAHNTSKKIAEQVDWTEPAKKRVWQRVVRDKVAHQSSLLTARAREQQGEQLRKIVPEVRSGDSTNREGHAARLYFSALFGPDFSRDKEIPLNAALNYGYAIILSAVSREIVARGYLTQVGICHRNEFNQFNLSCDLMEPFRPIVDRVVFDNFEGDFDRNFKLLLVDVLNQGIPYKGGSYRVGSVISLYVGDCLKALNRRLSVDEIEAFGIL